MRRRIFYITTLLIELFVGIIRVGFLSFLFSPLMFILALMARHQYIVRSVTFNYDPILEFGRYALQATIFGSLIIGLVLGYLSILLSIHAISGLGSGLTFTRFVFGARQASTRESEKILDVLSEIASRSSDRVLGFSRKFIIDSPVEVAYLVGTTLYLSSSAVNSAHLPVILAHELGHQQQKDGSLILALRRLVSPLFQVFISDVQRFSTGRADRQPDVREFNAMEVYFAMVNKITFFVLAVLGGGVGLYVMSWAWAGHFRDQDYRADRFVVKLGYQGELLEYLEENKFHDTSIPYMLGWQPANELRIDRLQYPRPITNSFDEFFKDISRRLPANWDPRIDKK